VLETVKLLLNNGEFYLSKGDHNVILDILTKCSADGTWNKDDAETTFNIVDLLINQIQYHKSKYQIIDLTTMFNVIDDLLAHATHAYKQEMLIQDGLYTL